MKRQYVEGPIMQDTIGNYDKNNLYNFINEVTHGQADKLFRYFNVGTSKSGNTVYWMVNVEGKICQPKIIIYKPDGHRDKSKPPIAAIGYTMDSGFRPCLFGEQYLKSGKTVMIVESEKTCILSHYIFPEYTWIASGGKNGLSSEKINVLEGHKVVIIPDADEDGRKSASVAKERLKKKGIACTVKDLFPGRNDGFDLADYAVICKMQSAKL